jgi:hypothetical protein
MENLDISPTAQDPMLTSAAGADSDDGVGLRVSPRRKRAPITLQMPWPERIPKVKEPRAVSGYAGVESLPVHCHVYFDSAKAESTGIGPIRVRVLGGGNFVASPPVLVTG